jgi:serine/threonine-protein kinase
MAAQVIADRYRIDGRLGVGGMSTVHRAFDARLEREVAIKLLAEHLAEDETFVSRFRREALAAARLVHPNIVQVFDFGLDEGTEQHFIVMELVIGRSCAEILREVRVVAVDEALDTIGQACRGLEHAHRNGVVHRDVKPGNLLRSDDGVVKLADFGIARAADQSSITQVGSVLGTAAYLAPEQARGEEAGPAADIYALAVVTYQMLAGRLPYEAASLSELTLKQQREAPPPLDAVNPEVPPQLARAVGRGLAIDPGARYESALAMGEALRAGARGLEPPPSPVPDVATEATRALPRDDETEATRMMGPRRRPMTPVRRGAPAAPSAAPPRRARDEAQPAARRGGRAIRTLLVLTMLALLGALAAVIVAGEMSDRPELRRVVVEDAQRAIEEVREFVEDNTR